MVFFMRDSASQKSVGVCKLAGDAIYTWPPERFIHDSWMHGPAAQPKLIFRNPGGPTGNRQSNNNDYKGMFGSPC
jgi:hypothetical protein